MVWQASQKAVQQEAQQAEEAAQALSQQTPQERDRQARIAAQGQVREWLQGSAARAPCCIWLYPY